MAKRIVAVNAGPRKGWNTDTLTGDINKGSCPKMAGSAVEILEDIFEERHQVN